MQSHVSSFLAALRGRFRFPALLLLLLIGSVSLTLLWNWFGATANPVSWMNYYDEAHVLDQDQVIRAAGGVGYNIDLYTTNTFDGTAGDLAAFARGRFTAQQFGTLVIVIDTVHRRLAIQDNGAVPDNQVSFNAGQYQAAQLAFRQAIVHHGFTAAAVAVLQSLSRARAANRTPVLLLWVGITLLELVALTLLLAIILYPDGGFRRKEAGECELHPTPLA